MLPSGVVVCTAVACMSVFTWDLSDHTSLNAYFLSGDPYHLTQDGRKDKNRQTIAVTLRLRFAVRVNN